MNLLRNSDFRAGTYEPEGQTSLVLPVGWEFGWLDKGKLWRTQLNPDGTYIAAPYGDFNRYGPRPREGGAQMLKPEILTITAVQPYLDPPRVEPPFNSVTGFKLYGTSCWWMFQQVEIEPGKRYRLMVRAQAWALSDKNPQAGDAHYSEHTGKLPYHSLEGTELDGVLTNFRFRLGIDQNAGTSVFHPAVTWAPGIHIYNQFYDVPGVEFVAAGSRITVFLMVDNTYGFLNSNAFVTRLSLEELELDPGDELRARIAAAENDIHNLFGSVQSLQEHLDDMDARVKKLEEGTPTPGTAPIITLQPMNAISYAGAMVKFTASASGEPRPTCAWMRSDDGGATWKQVQGLDTLLSFVASVSDNGSLFKAVFTNPSGTVTSDVVTLSVVQVSWRKRLQSLASFHIEGTGAKRDGKTGYGYGDFLRDMRLAGRAVNGAKGFLTAGELMQLEKDTPGAIGIWRGRPIDIDEDNPRSELDWKWAPSQSRDIARRWIDGLLNRAKLDLPWITYLEAFNEPNGALELQFQNQNAVMLEAMQYIDTMGPGVPKLAICSWSSGCPKTPLIQPGEMDQLSYFVPALEYAAIHGHVLAVHEGSLNPDRPLFRQAYQDKTALRYRYVKALMDSLGKPMPMVAVTEGYWPGGYQNRNPWDDMIWFLDELGKDPYVILFAWFTLGSYSFDNVHEVNVVGQMTRYLEAAKLVPPLDGKVTLANRIQRLALSVRETPKRLRVYYGKR